MSKLKCMMICEDREKPASFVANLPCLLIIVLVLAVAYAESGAQAVPPNSNQPDQGKPIMSASQAHRILNNFLYPMEGQVTNKGFSFIWDPKIGTRKYIKFSEIKNLKIISDSGKYYVSELGASDFPVGCLFYWPDNESASIVIHAINAMRYYSSDSGLAEETAHLIAFKEKARAWRGLSVKPVLPTEVQRCRVVAEDAFRNKEFNKAIEYYEKGLDIYPLWPEGQFNTALISGEMKLYAEAVGHMKRYLELVPDAKDAKAAQEKIVIWEEKAKQ